MVSYTHADDGKVFCPTKAGMKIGRIRSKFCKDSPVFKKSYIHTVPTAWVNCGWVEEKEIQNGKET